MKNEKRRQKKADKRALLGIKHGHILGKMRPGDWSCAQCHNFNWSFRESCNTCGITKH